MATSGSFNTSGYDGRYLTLSWAVQSQSIENNASTISWTLKGAGVGGSNWYRAGNFKVVINGVTVYSSSTRIQLYNGTVVSSGTLQINHNNDGTKTFSAYAEAGIYTVAVNCTGSATFELPAISRYATATGGKNFTDVQNPSVSFTNPAGSKLQFKIEAGGNANLITRDNVVNATSPYTFTLTTAERNSLRALCPNSNTLSVKLTVGTYNSSGSVVNTSSVTKTMTITNANPTISGASYQDTNSATIAITGNNQEIIQNKSTLQLKFTSLAALKYATLSKVRVTINGVTVEKSLSGTSASNTTVLFGTVNVSSNINAEISLIDSRNNVTSQNLAISIESWSTPSAIITCARKNNYYDQTDLTVNAEISSLNGQNSATIQYQYKKTDASSWSALTTIQNNTTTTFNIDNSFDWNIKVVVSDLLGSTTYNLTVDRGIPIVFFDRLKRSYGINCFPADNESLEVNGINILKALFFQAGDSITFQDIQLAGLLTNNAKSLRFSIVLPKSTNGLTVTCTDMKLNVRNTEGGYTLSSAYVSGGYDVLADNTITVGQYNTNVDYILTFKLDKTTAYNGTSNTPQAVVVDDLTLEFS